jgi:hypothetical protein
MKFYQKMLADSRNLLIGNRICAKHARTGFQHAFVMEIFIIAASEVWKLTNGKIFEW